MLEKLFNLSKEELQKKLNKLSIEEKQELYKLLYKKKQLENENKLKKITLNRLQRPFLLDNHKITAFFGSNRSGKTFAGAIKLLMRALGIIPDCIKDEIDASKCKPGLFWVIAPSTKKLIEITIPKVIELCPKNLIKKYPTQPHYQLKLKNGSIISFKSAEAGLKEFMGASVNGIWFDEEPEHHGEKIYDECFMRTIDCNGDIWFTETPEYGLSWTYRRLFLMASKIISWNKEEGKLQDEAKGKSKEEYDSEIAAYIATDEDNYVENGGFVPSEWFKRTEKQYTAGSAKYQAKVKGRFTILQGKCVFNEEILQNSYERCKNDFEQGKLNINKKHNKIYFVHRNTGNLRVYKHPEKGKWYVIGVDVAEGKEGGDFTVAQVLEKDTWEQVAVYHGKPQIDLLPKILNRLGIYYNNAYIAVENNSIGLGVVNNLKNHEKYKRLYYTKVFGEKTERKTKKYGWHTNGKTKGILIEELGRAIQEKLIKFNDRETIKELLTFVHVGYRKWEAAGGCYDDRVMALGIAVMVALKSPKVIRTGIHTTNPTNRTTNY